MMVLLLLVLVVVIVGVLIAFVGASKNVRSTNNQDDFPTLSFDSQAIYRPVRSLVRGIREIAESSTDPAVRAMAGSVRDEIQQAHDRTVQALQTRDQLRKAINGSEKAESEVARLTGLHESADSATEKLAYAKALDAKTGEMAEYLKAKELIKRIENEVEMTKASLSELKSKLAVAAASVDAADRAEDLRSSLSSLETIQSSVAEAQEVLRA